MSKRRPGASASKQLLLRRHIRSRKDPKRIENCVLVRRIRRRRYRQVNPAIAVLIARGERIHFRLVASLLGDQIHGAARLALDLEGENALARFGVVSFAQPEHDGIVGSLPSLEAILNGMT